MDDITLAGWHCGAMRHFTDDDGGYLDWLAANPERFVINAARNPSAAHLVLHRARCGTIGRQPARGGRWTADYVKYCGERAELEAFARDHLAGDLRSCGLCLRRPAERRQPSASHAGPARAPQQDTGASRTSGQATGPLPAELPTALAETAAASAPPPVMFAMPDSQPAQLHAAPRLASWNRADDPAQTRLEAYLAAAEQLLLPRCEQLTGPLALRLDIGLPPATPLLDQRDLDNYLYPLAARLSKTIGPRLVSVWGTKHYSRASFARIEQATPIHATSSPGYRYTVRTSSSSQSIAFKQQIHDQLIGAATLPDGPVSMQLSFTVGPDRNWLNLWKPTIDAQRRILGNTNPSRPWHPQDGRIVELGLHCQVDHTLGNDILITIDAITKQT
jgi:hypothetical protein